MYEIRHWYPELEDLNARFTHPGSCVVFVPTTKPVKSVIMDLFHRLPEYMGDDVKVIIKDISDNKIENPIADQLANAEVLIAIQATTKSVITVESGERAYDDLHMIFDRNDTSGLNFSELWQRRGCIITFTYSNPEHACWPKLLPILLGWTIPEEKINSYASTIHTDYTARNQ